jgi:hypothetical protein
MKNSLLTIFNHLGGGSTKALKPSKNGKTPFGRLLNLNAQTPHIDSQSIWNKQLGNIKNAKRISLNFKNKEELFQTPFFTAKNDMSHLQGGAFNITNKKKSPNNASIVKTNFMKINKNQNINAAAKLKTTNTAHENDLIFSEAGQLILNHFNENKSGKIILNINDNQRAAIEMTPQNAGKHFQFELKITNRQEKNIDVHEAKHKNLALSYINSSQKNGTFPKNRDLNNDPSMANSRKKQPDVSLTLKNDPNNNQLSQASAKMNFETNHSANEKIFQIKTSKYVKNKTLNLTQSKNSPKEIYVDNPSKGNSQKSHAIVENLSNFKNDGDSNSLGITETIKMSESSLPIDTNKNQPKKNVKIKELTIHTNLKETDGAAFQHKEKVSHPQTMAYIETKILNSIKMENKAIHFQLVPISTKTKNAKANGESAVHLKSATSMSFLKYANTNKEIVYQLQSVGKQKKSIIPVELKYIEPQKKSNANFGVEYQLAGGKTIKMNKMMLDKTIRTKPLKNFVAAQQAKPEFVSTKPINRGDSHKETPPENRVIATKQNIQTPKISEPQSTVYQKLSVRNREPGGDNTPLKYQHTEWATNKKTKGNANFSAAEQSKVKQTAIKFSEFSEAGHQGRTFSEEPIPSEKMPLKNNANVNAAATGRAQNRTANSKIKETAKSEQMPAQKSENTVHQASITLESVKENNTIKKKSDGVNELSHIKVNESATKQESVSPENMEQLKGQLTRLRKNILSTLETPKNHNSHSHMKLLLEESPLGKVEMNYKEQLKNKTLKIVVESESIKNEVLKMLPQINDQLHAKGLDLVQFRVDVGAFTEKENFQKNKHKNNSNAKTNKIEEVEDESAKHSTINIKEYGYNTIEYVA